jgi:glycosyltransferase involved in cell wall biosynthesis
VREFRPDAILGVGQNVLPVLAAIRERPVIWYAGDEPTILHLSLLKNYRTSNRIRSLQEAFYSLIYERTLLSRVSGVVVVSELDRFAMRWIAGARKVVTIPNGVDLEKFHTNDGKKRPYSVIFWGRMDYPPNVDAVLWFYEEVFLVLKRKYEQAEFVIVGADPHALVLDLGKKSGVRVLGEVEDIRPYVWSAACTVIPIRLGHGIKNKLLEASALGAAAVISPQCLNGLRVCKDDYPWLVAKSKDEWIRSVEHLWWDEDARIRLGRKARRWVEESHTWEAVAQSLQEFLKELSTSLQA